MAMVLAMLTAWVSRRLSSSRKSWTMPATRTEVTSTPASRSLLAYCSADLAPFAGVGLDPFLVDVGARHARVALQVEEDLAALFGRGLVDPGMRA